ncbi:MAG: arginine--tRNA ligase [Parvularculaceae bacterium]|nr:arginine--tRNA ligase [Parvularculaceae bacterium]
MLLTEELSGLVGRAFAAEGYDAALGAVRVSDRPDLAQFQCNGALAAAKAAKANPRAVGEKIAARLKDESMFSEVSLAGPGFINLTLTDDALASRIAALAADHRLGGWTATAPETVVLDYGGPNVAKPLHVGHLRSAIIGECLKRLFRFVGWTVYGDIHLGDWGLPMGQLITELKREQPSLPYFDEAISGPYPDASPVTLEDLERLYPQASAACKADEARAAEARQATAELQAGRPGYRALWKHFISVSRAGIEREYDDLGATFDWWKGEADVDPLIAPMVDKLRAKGVAVEDKGAVVIRVARDDDKKEYPPLILYKSDGGVMYGTTDLATIVDRVESVNPDRMLYVVDGRQRDHFEQVFRASDIAGIYPKDRLEHLWFGTMNGKDGKPFKTRAGGVLKLRDLIDMVEERAAERLKESGFAEGYGDDEAAEVAHRVGLAALKFADLSNPRTSDYIFDIDRFVAFEGKTGPYLHYASVRVRSVLKKAEAADAGAPGPILITEKEERDLALTLLQFGEATKDAVEKRLPHYLCEHAFTLAQAFSKFYAACRMVDEKDDAIRTSRLSLATAAGRQLDVILDVLGMPAPEQM